VPRGPQPRVKLVNFTFNSRGLPETHHSQKQRVSTMKKLLAATLMAGTALMGFAGTASAEDNPWMVRARVIGVLPDESGALSVGGTRLQGGVDIGDQYVPELDITYFFNKNIAAELILGVTPHDVKATSVTVPGALTNANIDLGDVWLLPPTLTLQYHFQNGTRFKPYVGAGVNATFFFNEDAGPVADGIDYDPSFGPALQAGFDYDLDGEEGGWALNADIKKVWINTDVTVDFTTALGASVDADVDINPLIVGVGLGYKF
jgi:outer membrane protein